MNRNVKIALSFTTPGSTRVVYNRFKIVPLFHMIHQFTQSLIWINENIGQSGTRNAYSYPLAERFQIIVASRRDSDLEAFSHNPSDGSFAPLAYQPST